MKIIDKYDKENCTDILSGCLDILSDDGRPLFTINELVDGSIEISTSTVCKYRGKLLDSKLVIVPKSSNCIVTARMAYD